MDSSNGGLHHEVTGSSRERCDPGSLQSVVKNDTFGGNNRRDIGRGIGKAV